MAKVQQFKFAKGLLFFGKYYMIKNVRKKQLKDTFQQHFFTKQNYILHNMSNWYI